MQVADPLEAFAPFKAYKRRGIEAAISCVIGAQAQRAVTDWAFTLCKANMQARQHRDPVICQPQHSCMCSVHLASWPAVQWGVCRRWAASEASVPLWRGRLQAFYEGARDMGWSDTKKRAQLTAPEARLLVVTGKVVHAVHLPTPAGPPSHRWCL